MLKRIFVAALVAGIIAVISMGCGGCGSGGGGDAAPASDASTISLFLRADPSSSGTAACAQSGNECDCPRGASATLTLVARDAQGDDVTVDAASVKWSSSDPSAVSLEAKPDGTAVVTGNKDWFDNSPNAEGSATVGVSYDGATASMPVAVVIDASGTWKAVTQTGFALTLVLTQKGRTVLDLSAGYDGSIKNDTFTFDIGIAKVSAHFLSRTSVTGTATQSSGQSTAVTCTKQ
jgi:hypothetical protein